MSIQSFLKIGPSKNYLIGQSKKIVWQYNITILVFILNPQSHLGKQKNWKIWHQGIYITFIFETLAVNENLYSEARWNSNM